MSQEKVDKYKEQKANRKEMMIKEKRMRAIRGAVAGVIVVALLGWIGYSAIGKYQDSRPRQVADVDYSAFMEYAQSLSVSETTE